MLDDYEIAEEVVSECESFFHVDPRQKSRRVRVAKAKHICCYLLNKHTEMSTGEIGDYMGYKDHSTIRHAVQRVERDEVLLEFAQALWARTSFHVNHPTIHRIAM